jgi:hypothetical protein
MRAWRKDDTASAKRGSITSEPATWPSAAGQAATAKAANSPNQAHWVTWRLCIYNSLAANDRAMPTIGAGASRRIRQKAVRALPDGIGRAAPWATA